ncbi:MAG: hypothetical protein AB7V16_01325 [Vulcanibacillus sp.]
MENVDKIFVGLYCEFESYIILFIPAGIVAIKEMLDMMPKAMVGALGFGELGTTLITFITSYLYVFLILQMLGDAGEKLNWIGNLSLYSLFDANKLFEGSSFACLEIIICI